MIKRIDRSEDARTSSDLKNKTNDVIIIPARIQINYGNDKDIELDCDGKTIFAYSYTLGRNFENWEIVRLLEEVGYAFNK